MTEKRRKFGKELDNWWLIKERPELEELKNATEWLEKV